MNNQKSISPMFANIACSLVADWFISDDCHAIKNKPNKSKISPKRVIDSSAFRAIQHLRRRYPTSQSYYHYIQNLKIVNRQKTT